MEANRRRRIILYFYSRGRCGTTRQRLMPDALSKRELHCGMRSIELFGVRPATRGSSKVRVSFHHPVKQAGITVQRERTRRSGGGGSRSGKDPHESSHSERSFRPSQRFAIPRPIMELLVCRLQISRGAAMAQRTMGASPRRQVCSESHLAHGAKVKAEDA